MQTNSKEGSDDFVVFLREDAVSMVNVNVVWGLFLNASNMVLGQWITNLQARDRGQKTGLFSLVSWESLIQTELHDQYQHGSRSCGF